MHVTRLSNQFGMAEYLAILKTDDDCLLERAHCLRLDFINERHSHLEIMEYFRRLMQLSLIFTLQKRSQLALHGLKSFNDFLYLRSSRERERGRGRDE